MLCLLCSLVYRIKHNSIPIFVTLQEFDEEGYKYIVDGWKVKLGRVEQGDQRWGLFYAEKA